MVTESDYIIHAEIINVPVSKCNCSIPIHVIHSVYLKS